MSEDLSDIRVKVAVSEAEIQALIRGAVSMRAAMTKNEDIVNTRFEAVSGRILHLERKDMQTGYILANIRERLSQTEATRAITKKVELILPIILLLGVVLGKWSLAEISGLLGK